MLRLCAAVRILVAAAFAPLGACRTTPRETCFPERGTEVWVEVRYPATAPAPGTPASLAWLRLTPAAGRQAQVWLIGPAWPARPDTITAGAVNADGYVGLPPAARALRPGVYTVRVRELGRVDAVRDVSVRPGERLELDVQSRQAAYCLGPVIQTSVSSDRDLPPNVRWN